ncbi:L,D-transpeptidase family protein [Clostridium formicaceticum]|uniref:L,D-transpeptidase catalytic domain n=1 Tax=Clostridium formicaceticum TaxID=1497 RepID=A0AAC9WG43_9CLOT|nr:L,D-transpeptidase family protein [Clostridium formicaceticum]AOY77016.1 hypothetical protein BJL90_14825 [Clostridium formicaceticum]ARE87508.1 L,D-transpeptidase catalytic domain [Clostridium formicaceticum]
MKNLIYFLVIAGTIVVILSGNIILEYLNSTPPIVMDNSTQFQEVGEANTFQTTENLKLFLEKPQIEPSSASIKIYKELRVLELYGDEILIGRFKIALGGNPIGDKNQEGDSKTPEGQYYICTRNDRSKYTLFLGLSYPNIEDAQRGLKNELIDEEIFNIVKYANEHKQRPPWDTPLGGAVGIHGKGNAYDWTLGCIALSDEDIKVLWDYTSLKTPVEIFK